MKCGKVNMESLQRICLVCNRVIIYKSKLSFYNANKRNSPCHKCSLSLFNTLTKTGTKHTSETKQKMSLKQRGNYDGIKNHFYGKKHSLETKIKISNNEMGEKNPMFGKTHTEEVKEKLRTLRLNKIKKLGMSVKSYNPVACKYIDMLNEKLGLKLQHALNGGEIGIIGYSLDGYDKEKNIVFEYDEPNHNKLKQKEKDLIRQDRIIKKINPVSFIRYDEKYKKLYDVITNKEII